MGIDTSPIDYQDLMLGQLTDQVRDLFQRIFESEGSLFGEGWAPLSPVTEARKLRLGQPDAILVADDDLRRSLAFGVGDGYAELRENGTVLAVGTDDPKGPFHQLGTRRMPQRKIAPDASEIPETEISGWTDIVERHTKREIGNRLRDGLTAFKSDVEGVEAGAEEALSVALEGLEGLAEILVL